MSNEAERIARLERRVDYLVRYLGINPANIIDGVLPDPDDRWPGGPGGFSMPNPNQDADWVPEALYDALRRGKTIEAIKIYREVTGAGLAEAKAGVEAIARRM